MFTGLIEGTGTLVRIERQGRDSQLLIRADFAMEEMTLGESIAVDGVCLTVVSCHGERFSADVSAETLERTTLGEKRVGSRLNLERALRLGDRLGGHLVSGHVDGVGTLVEETREGRSRRLFFSVPEPLGSYLVEKGSVAINGISLTVNGCGADRFDVNIVPHTAELTTIGSWSVGQRVNIETDLIGKYVAKMLAAWRPKPPAASSGSRIDQDFLKKFGFS